MSTHRTFKWTCPLILAATCVVGGNLFSTSPATAKSKGPSIDLKVAAAEPTMMAGKKANNYVRISLTGGNAPKSDQRPAVNVAIVIDNSGSMSGQKIQQARQAAIAAVQRLQNNDVVSVVLYNSSVSVLVPATKATDRQSIVQKIRSVEAGGNTALFAGVSKGAAEVRKFLADDSVNRVILLSDGLANVGPSSPHDLERLGATLLKEGISVSTLGLGLGYNEDLMSRLAAASSGNHVFVETEDDLIAVFNNEFNELMSCVAADFEIHVRVAKRVRPVKVIGHQADIRGRDIYIPLAQLYAGQQRYFVLEVEVEPGEKNSSRKLANVTVNYRNLITEASEKVDDTVRIKFTDSIAQVEADRDLETFAYCKVQLANERNVKATALRDAGEVEKAEALLRFNVEELRVIELQCAENNVDVVLPALRENIRANEAQASLVQEKDWNRNRKSMRAFQNKVQAQQRVSNAAELGPSSVQP